MLFSRSLTRPAVSTSSSRCDPPCRSRPRLTTVFGIQPGRLSSLSRGTRLGAEKMIPSRMMPRMMVTLNFENCSIAFLRTGEERRSGVVRALLAGFLGHRRLRRFGRAVDDVGDGGPHDPDLHARGDLHLDVVVRVVGLGDDAENAARGH